jgi:glutaredoxin
MNRCAPVGASHPSSGGLTSGSSSGHDARVRSVRFVAIALVLCVTAPSSIALAADPEVKMFGATWCGPCRAVKQFLEQSHVEFAYYDIDDPKNREAFRQTGSRGIPVLFVGREKILGANFERIQQTLERSGKIRPTALQRAQPGTYGGHRPEWWQAQFRELRKQVADLDAEITALAKSATDSYEKEVVARRREDKKIAEETLDQLESDASNVSLPRNYRE